MTLAFGQSAEGQAAAENYFAGRLDRLTSATTAVVVLDADGRSVGVRLAPGAEIVHGRDGAGEDLTDFVPGEKIVFRATEHEDADYVADEFQSMVEATNAQIRGRRNQRLQTSTGDFVVSPVLAGEPQGAVGGGAARITYWTDPRTGTRYASAVTSAG